MATQNEALDLRRRARRRLVGAIALVLFLVIVPPLVMDLEPKPVTTTLNVEIPKQEGSRVLPPPPAPTVEPEPVPVQSPEPAQPEEPATPPAATTPSAPTADLKPSPAPAANSQSTYIIALATLSKKDNVKQLQSKVGKAGIKTFTEPVKTPSGEQTRVRAGPFASREAAEKARAKLQELGVHPGAVTVR
ncbi:MAG TPA: SPOR domain-containing protein [Burkholderiales bacterium]|nr:SPOR domain-containing protein [Burkholderiales bacterium]